MTNHCVLVSAGPKNSDVNSRNVIFNIKGTKLNLPVITLSAKENLKPSKFLGKGIETLVYWDEYEIKLENKSTTNEYRYFFESNFVEVNRLLVVVFSNRDDNG